MGFELVGASLDLPVNSPLLEYITDCLDEQSEDTYSNVPYQPGDKDWQLLNHAVEIPPLDFRDFYIDADACCGQTSDLLADAVNDTGSRNHDRIDLFDQEDITLDYIGGDQEDISLDDISGCYQWEHNGALEEFSSRLQTDDVPSLEYPPSLEFPQFRQSIQPETLLHHVGDLLQHTSGHILLLVPNLVIVLLTFQNDFSGSATTRGTNILQSSSNSYHMQ